MRNALILLSALVICACKTTAFQPIEIDLSKRTPSAVETPPPAPTPTPKRSAASASPAAAPGPESAATPASAAARPGARTPSPAPAPEPTATPVPAPAEVAVPGAAAPMPRQIVEAQLAAYNRGDTEAFAATYAADAVVYDPPEQIKAAGIEAIRKTYAKAFADAPGAKATISQRLTQGNFVVDQESISGYPDGRSASTIVVYEVRDGRIRRVWFLR